MIYLDTVRGQSRVEVRLLALKDLCGVEESKHDKTIASCRYLVLLNAEIYMCVNVNFRKNQVEGNLIEGKSQLKH